MISQSYVFDGTQWCGECCRDAGKLSSPRSAGEFEWQRTLRLCAHIHPLSAHGIVSQLADIATVRVRAATRDGGRRRRRWSPPPLALPGCPTAQAAHAPPRYATPSRPDLSAGWQVHKLAKANTSSLVCCVAEVGARAAQHAAVPDDESEPRCGGRGWGRWRCDGRAR